MLLYTCKEQKLTKQKTKYKENGTMKMNDIMNVIVDLSFSQGFYGRLYRDIMELKSNSPSDYDLLVEELEGQNFKDALDVVLYFEC